MSVNYLRFYVVFVILFVLLVPAWSKGMTSDDYSILTRAGQNVTMKCDAARETYVLQLVWKLLRFGDNEEELQLVEFRTESTTLFRHESRMTLDPVSYELSFRPVTATDSGHYICRVNSLPHLQTKIKLTVQDVPDPPGKPFMLGFTSRSVNLSWTAPKSNYHSSISHYIIHVRQGENGHWDVENGRASRDNSTEFTVDKLLPFTVYSFRVIAVNAIGQSKPSDKSFYIVTLREKPEGRPIFTAVHNASSTSLQLNWKPPPQSSIHGEFSGYIISLRERSETDSSKNAIEYTIKDPNVTSKTIKNLKTFTPYLVSLKVFNPEGEGPATTVSVMTDEGAPGPPRNVTVVAVKDRSVDLWWMPPAEPNGEIRGYWIYYVRGNFTSVKTQHVNDSTAPVRYELKELEPNTRYVIRTKAFTQSHEGNSSNSVQITTDYSGPGSPIISNLTCKNETELFLHWLRPAQVYGTVDVYYIYYRPEDSFDFEEIAVSSLSNRLNNHFLISNLSTNTMYEVKMRGGTYSRVYPNSSHIYRGPFSEPRKILLIPNCHRAAEYGSRPPIELNAEIIAAIVCAGFAILLLLVAMLVWKRFFQGAYYYLDDPPKTAPVVMHDWENDTGADGAFGPIDVHDFAKHVADLHADGDIGFSKEYESILAASAQEQLPAEHSQHPDNKQKNRYLNIVAYDHSRVALRPLPGQKKMLEYVNANYIDGYDKACAYIGTQGPLPSTFDTFWRMIWEQHVHIIVMITNLVERGRKKCDQYWPKEGAETYGFIQVRLVHEEILATYTIRKLAIKHLKVKCKKTAGSERMVYQYHYTNWPDHGTPDHPLPVLSFVRKSASANPDDAGPIIVHCSAGVGRTGTYIVLDAMMQQIRAKGRLNIWGFLKHIRTQRNFLVQTEEQYIFIHDALLEAIQSGDTCIPKAGLGRYIRMLQSPGGCQEKPQPWYLLTHQFKLVTNFQPRDFNVVSAVKPANREKNRSLDHLPMENGRVHLTPKAGVDGSDYINATWQMGHNRMKEFILTQHPLPHTLLDFWQMVWDHNAQTIVVLTPVDDSLNLPQFWPSQDEDYDSDNWKVHFLEERLHSGLVILEVAVQSLQDDYELRVQIVHAPGWPHSLPALTTTLTLVSLVLEIHTNYQNGPLVVVDKYGATEAATFACMATLKNQCDFENHMDPYMYFKLYHNRRPSIWTNQDDLLFIYRALESYAVSASSHSGSSSDMAGFSDPVIAMPPVTSAPLPPATPVPKLIHMSVDVTATPQQQPVLSPAAAPLDLLPVNGCANGQVVLVPPCGFSATALTGNGTVRVPPDGREDLPQATDAVPIV